ncbi:hypothetical protein QOL99_07250 [Deinococcus sp. MIMF12]|uniref:CHRD domain-containing protein n=1 Tax=Deinococcus rhizophilus TaxID=3049544 RepID=A0ABT7JFW9_9DEIO|nr:hypothetical protein [Deinococcus rhizophilus]MDL2343945.1 hypothetical protein [Deinococcus rhizophilus]
MPRRLTAAALLALLTLASCGPRAGEAADDLTAQVLFTGNGTYDRQGDRRGEKVAGGLRETVWETAPPLPARRVTVRYDSGARPLSWALEIEAPGFSAADLAGEGARRVRTSGGTGGLRPAPGSRLADTVILEEPSGDLRVLTRGYAVQAEAGVLGAFR